MCRRPAGLAQPGNRPVPRRWKAAGAPFDARPEPLFREPAAHRGALTEGSVYLAGTFDTKGAELGFIRDRLVALGVAVKTVDLSTSGNTSSANVPPHIVAASHPRGASGVFTGDRGEAVGAMAEAFEAWLVRQPDVAGIIAAGGSGGTSLATPAMQALPVGIPKVMISTVASGEVGRYVGAADIMMMYSVTDVQGLNRISRTVLANGANAMAGMLAERRKAEPQHDDKPCLGLTMFGVTTTAVQQITGLLEDRYDCLVFHATGTGGRSMEKLADSGMLAAAVDLTTTEVCDLMMGGVFPATEDRFGAFIRSRLPYVGSVGALDMVNFGPRNTVPDRYRDRIFVEHNPQVTLMRTTPGGKRPYGCVDCRAAELDGRPGPLPDPGRRRLGAGCAGSALPRAGCRRRPVRRHRRHAPRNADPAPGPPAAPYQRSGLRPRDCRCPRRDQPSGQDSPPCHGLTARPWLRNSGA